MKLFRDIADDVRKRQNLDVYIAIILAVVVSALGFFQIADDVVISSAILATLALVSFSLLQSRRENDEIREKLLHTEKIQSQLEYLLALASNYSVKNEDVTKKIQQEINDLTLRLGLTVRFIQDHPKTSSGELYRAACEIIEKAEKEILVLYYRSAQTEAQRQIVDGLRSEAYRAEHEQYVKLFLNKLQQHKSDKFFYRRIIQFPEGVEAKFSEARVGKLWFEHTKAVLEVLKDYPEAGYIKKAPMFLDQTIVVVDERHIIWGIDAIDPDYDVRYTNGALFFDDPHQEFVRYVKSFILRADAHSRLIRNIPEQ